MERTVDFYTNVLGMPLVKTIELPAGMGQHFFFDCGGGDCLAFFWFPDAPDGVPGISAPAARPDQGDLTSAVGSMNHVAFDVAPEKIEEYRDRLIAAGVPCTEVANHDDSEWGISDEMHPGVFVRSVYFQDPDGILLEFACWMRSFTPSDVAHAPANAPAKAETSRWPPSPSCRRPPHPPPLPPPPPPGPSGLIRPSPNPENAPTPPGPQGRSHRPHRDHHVRMALRGPRPRRRAWPLGWHNGRLVDRVRQQSRHPRPLRQGLRPVPVARPHPRPEVARARPNPRRIRSRQPVRLQPARQVHPRARHARGADHAHPAPGASPPRAPTTPPSGPSSPTPTASSTTTAGSPTSSSPNCGATSTTSPSSSSPTSRRCIFNTP